MDERTDDKEVSSYWDSLGELPPDGAKAGETAGG